MATKICTLVLVVAVAQTTGCKVLSDISNAVDAGTLVSYSMVNSDGEVNTVQSTLLVPDEQNNQFNVIETNVDIEVLGSNDWRLDAIAASGPYLALASLGRGRAATNGNDPLDGKLEIYKTGTLKHRFEDKDLAKLIENASDLPTGLGREVYALHPFDLGFESERTLVVYIQPQRIDGRDETNFLLKLDVETGKAIGEVELFKRTPRRAAPTLPENSRFSLTVTDGVMSIEGQVLDELPNNIDEKLFTQSRIGN